MTKRLKIAAAPAVSKQINPKSYQHGSAAACELVNAINRINGTHRFGTGKAAQETKKVLNAHLEGYHQARGAARRGFLRMLGDFLGSAAAGCVASNPEEFYSGRKWHGRKPAPPARQRKALARAWVKGGAT